MDRNAFSFVARIWAPCLGIALLAGCGSSQHRAPATNSGKHAAGQDIPAADIHNDPPIVVTPVSQVTEVTCPLDDRIEPAATDVDETPAGQDTPAGDIHNDPPTVAAEASQNTDVTRPLDDRSQTIVKLLLPMADDAGEVPTLPAPTAPFANEAAGDAPTQPLPAPTALLAAEAAGDSPTLRLPVPAAPLATEAAGDAPTQPALKAPRATDTAGAQLLPTPTEPYVVYVKLRPVPEAAQLQPQPVPEPQPVPVLKPVPHKLADIDRVARTPELIAVGQRAEGMVRHGFELADRGAVYSARLEFIQALEMLAQAYDAQIGGVSHAKSLNAGLRALQEADDFLARGGQLQSAINVPLVISGHQTPILQGDGESLTELSPLQAVQQYLTYAQEQLAAAAGPEPAGSLALYGLGKIYSGPDTAAASGPLSSPPKAVVCQQAALLANQKNFLAANEMGVLLARYGRFRDARNLLQISLRIQPQPTTWRNLAEVHRALGERDLAAQAMEEARLAEQALPKSPVAPFQVQWVDSATFARDSLARVGNADSAATAALQRPANLPAAVAGQAGPTQPSAAAKKTTTEQTPWYLPRR